MILIYSPTPSKKEAERIGNKLLEGKFAACIQIIAANSIFPWKGKIEKTKEYIMLAKTKKSLARKAVEKIQKLHPYEIPCILTFEVDSNKAFELWMNKELQKR